MFNVKVGTSPDSDGLINIDRFETETVVDTLVLKTSFYSANTTHLCLLFNVFMFLLFRMNTQDSSLILQAQLYHSTVEFLIHYIISV